MILFVLFLIATFGGAFIGFFATANLIGSRIDDQNDLLDQMADALMEADIRIDAARAVLEPQDDWMFYTRRERRAYNILDGVLGEEWGHQAEGERNP